MKGDTKSEDENLKLNLSKDKDDEDDEEKSNNSESYDIKKSLKLLTFSSKCPPKSSIYCKRKLSSDSSDSSDSYRYIRNKKKKFKQLTTLQKSYVDEQKTNFERNYYILKEDFKLLEEYERTIFKDTNLDIMFIMDLTGSMGNWLDEAKKNICNIIEEILDNNPGSKIRMSFIGYRDYIEANQKRIYNSKEFTEDLNSFNEFLSNLDCFGGGDEPEDIVGALKVALDMDWQSNAKYVVLVCDAPCHGKKYHDISYDKFENGDPDGTTLEEVVKKFYEKGIYFYCIEIDKNTKKMFNIMKEVYNDDEKFHVEKLGNLVHKFSFFVTFSASALLGNIKYKKMKFSDILSNCRKEIIEKIMQKYLKNNKFNNMNQNKEELTIKLINEIENLNLDDKDKKLLDFINRMNCLSINNENKSDNIMEENNSLNEIDYVPIQINPNIIEKYKYVDYTIKAFSCNKNLNSLNDWANPSIITKSFKTQICLSDLKLNEKTSFYEVSFHDKILNKSKKGKIPFNIHKKYYNNPSLYLKDKTYNELISEQIADYFNIFLEEKLQDLKPFIKFEKHVLYDNEENNSNNIKYIISEESVPIELNISTTVDNRTLEAFSHFSYQITGGQLIISNLKYNEETKKISDFQIHFLKDKGYKNILEFFASHICDHTCVSIGLVHPRKKINPILIDEKLYSKKYITNLILCSCCSVPILYNEKLSKSVCELCLCNETFSKRKIICPQCNYPFYYSTYLYNSQLINYPQICPKCTKI